LRDESNESRRASMPALEPVLPTLAGAGGAIGSRQAASSRRQHGAASACVYMYV
jgi:hypothetical protein